jgi:hypothetical protein
VKRLRIHAAARMSGLTRSAERTLPFFLFNAVIWLLAAGTQLLLLPSARKQLLRLRQLPESIRPVTSLWRYCYEQLTIRQSALVSFWPDRLHERQWQSRCRMIGHERVEEIFAQQRPVILATLHYSSPSTLYYWLRSLRWRAAAFSYVKLNQLPAYRHQLNSLADDVNGLTGVPQIFGLDELWEARDFLAGGPNLLLFAIDSPFGHRPETVVIDDLTLKVQTGAFRLAMICDATVIPVLIRAEPGMEVVIQFGTPVPAELIARQDHRATAEHLLTELLPWVSRCSEQSSEALVDWLQGPKQQ